MKKFLLYVLGYSVLLSVLAGVIYVDRTTTFFDSTRNLIGIETQERDPIASSPTLMAVAKSYFAGEIDGAEARDALFGLRRYPDYRAILPPAQAGWSRHVPFRIDDRDIAEMDFEMLSQVFAGLSITEIPGVSGISQEQIDAITTAAQDVKAQIKDAVLDQNMLGLGGFEYKASAAYYTDGDATFLISVNKNWQSSFGSINEMGENFADLFGAVAQHVAVNGRSYRLTQVGDFTSLEHMVGTKARVYAIGRAPLEVLVAHLEQLDLEPIYRHHMGTQTRVAKRTGALPQTR